jgi:hypothetical protein
MTKAVGLAKHVVLLAALIFLVQGESVAQGTSLQFGQTVEGVIRQSGTERWTFSANTGDLVIIGMKSIEFDTYLELYGPDGALVISDDDGGTETDSEIVRELVDSGTYTISAGGLTDSDSGAYTLIAELSPEFATSVQTFLTEASIISGEGYIADGFTETVIDLTGEDNLIQPESLNGNYTDFVLGADIAWGPGASEDTCGFVFRRVDDDNYYVVEIDRNGNVWFIELSAGEWGESQGDRYLAVLTDSKDVNRMALVVTGNTFTVYVNGQRTGTFSDTSLTSGTTAVEMSTFESSDVTNCTFNNVWLLDTGTGETLPQPTPITNTTNSTPSGNLPTLAPPDNQSSSLPTKTPIGNTIVPTTAPTTTATVTITADTANLRSGPGTSFDRVDTARQGDTFNVVAQAGGGQDVWYLVSLSGNRQGWVWSGIVILSPSNAQIPFADTVVSASPVPGGGIPVIFSVTSQGGCDDITLVVSWTDPDGDATTIEWMDTDTGEVFLTENISGTGGNFSSVDWFCETDSCAVDLRIVDRAGNLSNTYQASATCS